MIHTPPLQDTLLGALIGLARAISGNEDLVTDVTDQLVIQALIALKTEILKESPLLSQLLHAVEDEKKRIVPDCAICCNPCGRTDNYDVEQLRNSADDIRILKYQVLADIQEMAYSLQDRTPSLTPHDLAAFLYKVLFALGIDYWTAEKWTSYAEEVRNKKSTF